jgi:hypothetical protein
LIPPSCPKDGIGLPVIALMENTMGHVYAFAVPGFVQN